MEIIIDSNCIRIIVSVDESIFQIKTSFCSFHTYFHPIYSNIHYVVDTKVETDSCFFRNSFIVHLFIFGLCALHCCARLPQRRQVGLLCLVSRLLIIVAFSEHGLEACRLQYLQRGSRALGINSCSIMRLAALWHVGCFQSRNQTHVPCTAGGF